MAEQKGPGETQWKANAEGGVDCIRWNDPSWRTRFMDTYDMDAGGIANKLRQAYEMGRRDQAELLRRVVAYGDKQ